MALFRQADGQLGRRGREQVISEQGRCRQSREPYPRSVPATWCAAACRYVGGGAGTGLSAKCEEAGGIDLIVIYNSGRYRMAGRGSAAGLLAYGNANEIVMEMAVEVLPVVKHTPVLAGVQRHRPVRADAGCFLGGAEGHSASPACRIFQPMGLFDGIMRAESRGDRHGLRAGGRHDEPRPTS